VITVEAIACLHPLCKYVNHNLKLNFYANAISESCITAANINIPHTEQTGSRNPNPSWMEYVEPVRNKSILW
jgi:hypothetical protein